MYKSLLIFGLTLFLSACMATKKSPNKPISSVQESLNKHRLQWKNGNIHNYSYEFRRSCFCMKEYTKAVLIDVKDGAVVSAIFKDNKQSLPNTLKDNRQTIKMLFDTVQKAIDRKAHNIMVKYDEQYGYPLSINVDYDEMIADEELYLSAKDLKARN